jgi:acetate kinase
MIEKVNSCILSINGGSSSLKFKLYSSNKLMLYGSVAHIGTKIGQLEIRSPGHVLLFKLVQNFKDQFTAATELINWFNNNQLLYSITAIGHRLVQGGPNHRDPEVITDELLNSLNEFVYLAPNHLPNEIKMIRLFKQAFPDVPQVACFDTAFHQDMPFCSKYYPLPSKFGEKGLIRYGFHGLSYEYIMAKLAQKATSTPRRKIIIAHLGNGASMAAVRNGICIDTTMGISPMGGLVMGTRSGDLDPGVILYLLKHDKLTPDEVDDLLSKQSGLKGIAGTGDVQELLKNEATDTLAREALAVFCYNARKYIGALAAAMGGLDMLVFTGGIGENSAIIRERICSELEFLGIEIHQKLNYDRAEMISTEHSQVKVKVIATDEEWMIAKHTQTIIDKTKVTELCNQ